MHVLTDSKHRKQKLIKLQGQIDKSTIIFGGLTPLTQLIEQLIDRKSVRTQTI